MTSGPYNGDTYENNEDSDASDCKITHEPGGVEPCPCPGGVRVEDLRGRDITIGAYETFVPTRS